MLFLSFTSVCETSGQARKQQAIAWGVQGFRKVGWIPALAMGELIFLGGDQPQIRSGAAPVRCETTTHLSFERLTV